MCFIKHALYFLVHFIALLSCFIHLLNVSFFFVTTRIIISVINFFLTKKAATATTTAIDAPIVAEELFSSLLDSDFAFVNDATSSNDDDNDGVDDGQDADELDGEDKFNNGVDVETCMLPDESIVVWSLEIGGEDDADDGFEKIAVGEDVSKIDVSALLDEPSHPSSKIG